MTRSILLDVTRKIQGYRLQNHDNLHVDNHDSGTPQAQMLAKSNPTSLYIDGYVKQAEEQTRLMVLQNAQAQKDRSNVSTVHGPLMPNGQQQQRAYSSPLRGPMHSVTVHKAQTDAHMGRQDDPGMTMGGKPFMTATGFDDPVSSRPPATPGVGLESDDDEFDLLR